MYSLQEFKQLKNPDCDYIVTTERILKADFPIIYISMALPEREMQKIKEGLKKFRKPFIGIKYIRSNYSSN